MADDEDDVDVVGIFDEISSQNDFEQKHNPVETFQDVIAKNKSWTEEEKHLFFQGMELFGRKWSKISRLIGSRTTMQVKNFAYHLWKKEKKMNRDHSMQKNIKTASNLSLCSPSHPNVHLTSLLKSTETVESLLEGRRDLNQVIEMKDGSVCLGHIHSLIEESANQSCEMIKVEAHQDDSDEEIYVDDLIPVDLNNKPCASNESSFLSLDNCDSNDLLHKKHDEKLQEAADKIIDSANVSISLDSEDSYKNLQPHNEKNNAFEIVVLDKTITDEEKEIHYEFFDGSLQKTPERYLKIRNHILNCWEKCKPEYLSKTTCRNGLKSCGDVNCIGRIHSYLEQIGAINFGCDKAKGRVKFQKPSALSLNTDTCRINRMDSMRPRKKKPDVILEEVAMKQGGYTMEHDSSGIVVKETVILGQPIPKRSRVNPYKLIPCKKFTTANHAPFKVEMTIDCLLIMDIHAHCLCTEVIGLLGGWYRRETKELQIRVAEPCDSSSTKIQCEMDPVSQTVASDALCSEGYQVVGWYHCHPTFAPLPSVQDLETQIKYQNLFKIQTDQPFVAVIISPYCQLSTFRPCDAINSTFNCIAFVDENKGDYHDFSSVPFSFHVPLTKDCDEGLSDATWRKIKYLNCKIKKHPDELNLLEKCKDYHEVSYLEKLLLSLTHHMKNSGINLQVVEDIAENIRRIMLSGPETVS